MLHTIRRLPAALVLATAMLAMAMLATAMPAAAQRTIPAGEKAQIEKIVRDYIVEHPEIIMQALDTLQQRQEVARTETQRKALAASREELFGDEAGPVAGNPRGDVTLVEFFDYQCGYCKSVHPSVVELAGDDTGLRIVYKEFPILGPASLTAAKAALAAERQGKYVDMHNALMELRGQLDEAKILRVAASIDLDVDRLKADMETDEVRRAIEDNLLLAQTLGINGTPAFIIGDQIIPGAVPTEELRKLVESERRG